ncbi:GPP34 family phosphoprotein [Micromonospora sp. NPDC049366]|uniref:GPP34 family phosphoprotein n=1 Tax=Micromonospora sp. NPDC049366 TaxID=3364271 RepID=UPI003789BC12
MVAHLGRDCSTAAPRVGVPRRPLHPLPAVTTDGPVEPRTAALVSLTRAVSLDRGVFRELPKDRVERRLTEISEGSWASEATTRAIRETQAALIAATTAAATAAIVTTTVS